VNEFIEQCRSEWRRLKVPETVADEMAAELAADLEQAEAEGVPAEEVLGSGAFDPGSFAASWASARGVVQARRKRRYVAVAAVTGLMLLAVIGALVRVGPWPEARTKTVTSRVTAASPAPARLKARAMFQQALLAQRLAGQAERQVRAEQARAEQARARARQRP
jgi:hypothetical protein